ncbi:hypothetical protein OKA04_10835 [Luteolibacter flavescens]|uniref:Uncharacterized protein n=1 Tax=Luteolibacter flavescens TaxID=1859460 RepID=A0ABT3FPG4_9BACT|nr:hypothetical protein [Luteolibacter flavescens]MCW1885224.1 hypothetical protein [Luteolibacter flavescens]
MKSLVLLPLSLLAVSCYPQVPYGQQRPPYRNGEPYYPYGPGGRAPGSYNQGNYAPDDRGGYNSGSGSERGQFEPVPGGNRPPPVNPAPPVAPRPTSPRINPDVDVPDSSPAPAPRPTYPDAKRTANPAQVISPYAPYNVIDVEGFKSGQLAKDPSNGKIFRVP